MAAKRREKAPKPPWTRGERIVRAVVWTGVAMVLAGMAVVGWTVLRGLTAGRTTTPSTVTRDLGRGDWVVFQRTGTRSGGGGFTFTRDGMPTMSPDEVRITGADGSSVPVRVKGPFESIEDGGRIYRSALQFHIDQGGRYRIEFLTDRGEVLVQRSIGDRLFGLRAWIASAILGVLLVIGLGLPLVVRRSRRREAVGPGWVAAAAPSTPVVPAAGWYPDPGNPGRQRWWDGSTWTDHQA